MDKYELAELIHSKDCKHNHIDGCGWYYENDPNYPTRQWDGWAHKDYLERAEKLLVKLEGMAVEDIIRVIKVL